MNTGGYQIRRYWYSPQQDNLSYRWGPPRGRKLLQGDPESTKIDYYNYSDIG